MRWVFLSLMVLVSACQIESAESETGIVQNVQIGPQLKDCYGLVPRKCMVVDDQLFYETIHGFTFEPGFHYELEIRRSEPYTDGEIPADASKYRYDLVRVISKTPA